jgi:polyhydroxybutyrate depolymerase
MMNSMKTKPVLVAVFFLLAGMLQAADLTPREWNVDGAARQALVYFPETTNPVSLVFAFHGHGGSAAQAARSFRIHEVWPDAMVVYMQGLPTVGQLTDPDGKRNGWNSKPDDPENRDLKFFDAVLSALQKEYKIDPKRIYSTGHSNGGGFTYCLWAARGDVFAAMAPSGALSRDGLPMMKPKPVLHLAGKTDPLVKFAWQDWMMKEVRKLNGCAEHGEPWASSGDLTGTIYPSATGAPVVTLIHPGGHTFPQEAPELMVRFFKECARK